MPKYMTYFIIHQIHEKKRPTQTIVLCGDPKYSCTAWHAYYSNATNNLLDELFTAPEETIQHFPPNKLSVPLTQKIRPVWITDL
jgi:hypothetical protein